MFVWGSETRVTYKFVTDVIAKEWKSHRDADAIQLEIVRGDDMADRWDEVTHENYDYLLVATSSYAEGDPPSGFGKFLYKCQETNREFDGNATDRKPLYGLQHAVLGVGDSQYETFQNIPRHIDMYLGACGSRRCKQRLEWDVGESSEKDIQTWAQEMIRVILEQTQNDEAANDEKANSKFQPEVCSWKEPNSEVFTKTVGEDGWEDAGRTQFEISPFMMILGFLIIVAGAWYQKQQDDGRGWLEMQTRTIS